MNTGDTEWADVCVPITAPSMLVWEFCISKGSKGRAFLTGLPAIFAARRQLLAYNMYNLQNYMSAGW